MKQSYNPFFEIPGTMKKFKTLLFLSLLLAASSLPAQVTFKALSNGANCDDSALQVHVAVENFTNITSMQFAMTWDTSYVQFTNADNFLPPEATFTPNGGATDTALLFNWFYNTFPIQGLNLSNGDTIFTLNFSVVGTAGDTDFDFTALSGFSIQVTNDMGQSLPFAFDDGIVEVSDNVNPLLTCPTDTTITTSGLNVTSMGFDPLVLSDNCSTPSLSYDIAGGNSGIGNTAGEVFTDGTTAVTFTATDDAMNTETCSFNVTVDAAPPLDTNLVITATPKINCVDNTVCVDFQVTNFDTISGIQFLVTWDTSILSYTGNVNNLPPTPTYNTFLSDTLLVFVWTEQSAMGLSLPDDSTIFSLKYDLVGAAAEPLIAIIGRPDLSFPIKVTTPDGDLNPMEYTIQVAPAAFIDNDPPVITCPTDITVDSDPDDCTAIVSVPAPMAMDDCDATLSLTNDFNNTADASGSYTVGSTTVVWTATDDSGNSATCSMTITVNDNEFPTITCPTDITVDAATNCQAAVTVPAPSFSDNCPGAVISNDFNFSPDASDTYPLGNTIVNWTVSDAAGNLQTCSMTVSVIDNEDPTITCPADITMDAAANCEAAVTVPAPSFGDNCPSPTITNDFNNTADASDTYPLGSTIVIWTATDGNGNTSTCSMTITIEDNENPTITCPTDISVPVNPACEAVVTVPAPSATDNCPGVSFSNDFNSTADASGTYPVGNTTVIWTATDANGNTSTCSMTVSVTDGENPTITCPADITMDANSSCEAVVTVPAPTVNDNCPGVIVGNDFNNTTDASGTYPLGVTTVIWTASDASGNTATCSMTITVNDAQTPTITCPADITVDGNSNCQGEVTVPAPVVVGSCTGFTLTNDFNNTDNASGTYAVGTTNIVWIVTDAAGNTDSCNMNVIVLDVEDPTITCPTNITATADAGGNATVSVPTPTVNDNCALGSVINNYNNTGNASDTYPLGDTDVTWTVTDVNGNTATCQMTITVTNNNTLNITCPPNVAQDATIGFCTAAVTVDLPSVNSSATIASVLNDFNNTDNASGTYPIGVTTVVWTVTDNTGNTETCSMTVTVSDTQDPIFVNCNFNDTSLVNDPGLCSAVFTWTEALAFDNCGIDSTYYNGFGPGDAFPVGTNLVEFIAVDNSGNTAVCSFNVTVTDGEAPVINCPADPNFDFEASALACSSKLDLPVLGITDNCSDFTVTVTGIPTDTIFPVGSTIIEYTATDDAGNSSACEITININDMTPPDITCPSNTNIEVAADPGLCTAKINLPVISAMDNCGPVSLDVQNIPTDTIFPLGATTITYTATDIFNNTSTCEITITVNDTQSPAFDCSLITNIVVDAPQGSCEAMVTLPTPVATDNCGNVTISTQGTPPNDLYPIGISTINFIATDDAGNTAVCPIDIIVNGSANGNDMFANCPADLTIDLMGGNCIATDTSSAPTFMPACASAGNVTIVKNPLGSFFGVGLTTVNYYAINTNGDTVATCTYDVLVRDVTAPELDCPTNIEIRIDGTVVSDPSNIILSATPLNDCSALQVVYQVPIGIDDCSPAFTTQTDTTMLGSGSAFPLGTTIQEYTATDTASNATVCMFSITISPLDSINASAAPDPACIGQNLQLFSETVMGATYSWTGPNAFTSNLQNPLLSNVAATAAGTYTVTASFANGCTASGITEVLVNSGPDITLMGDTLTCSDGTEGLLIGVFENAGSEPITSYNWTGPQPDSMWNGQFAIVTNATAQASGTYSVTVTAANGCSTTGSTQGLVTTRPVAPEVTKDCEDVICLGQSCNLIGSLYSDPNATYSWSATPAAGAGLPTNTSVSAIFLQPTEPGIYAYSYSAQTEGCDTDTTTIILDVQGAPEANDDVKEVDFETPLVNFTVTDNDVFNIGVGSFMQVFIPAEHGTIVYNGDGTYTYTPETGFVGTDQFTYQLCYENCSSNDFCDVAVVTLNVLLDGEDCTIPTLITPNGDGLNDELTINCLAFEKYPNNEMLIFNQWGDQVYQAAPYKNDWQGTLDGESGKDLPDGTYYFIFKKDSSSDPQKGYITIFR